jgi:hypothetical protein
MEPGRETPGDGISAEVVRQSPSLDEALGVPLTSPSSAIRKVDDGPLRCCMQPPGENGPEDVTGEALRRLTVGKPRV